MTRTACGLTGVLAMVTIGVGCGADAGAYCCRCTCCHADVTLERDDQSWPNCDDPCRDYCEQQLGCTEMVELAQPCDGAP